MEKKSTNPATLVIRDDLNLSSISFPKFPKDITVPEELNNFLRDQLDQMKRENESLQRELLKKESQLHESQIKIEKLTENCTNYEAYSSNHISASQTANCKIVDLAKKLRDKNSEIEVYKAKCAKLEKRVLEQEMPCENEQKTDKDEQLDTEPDQIQKLQSKLTYTTNKWIEEKNLTLQLKNDLKKANKWLQQEVGDKFQTLLSLNGSNSSWRGRAQIICDLQQKNQELKEKLKTYQENNTEKYFSDTELSQVKSEKKIEALNKENSELKSNYSDLKNKYDVLKLRSKALENEYSHLKTKVATLSEVHETDQQTIAKLTLQLSCHNDLKTEDLKQKDQFIRTLQEENESLKVALTKEKCISENKSRELLEKNDDIQILNKRIRSSRPPSSYVHKHDNNEDKVINRLEVERLRLLELTEIQNARLEEERNSGFKTQHMLRIEKQRCAKLEANLARLQLECNNRSGYGSKINISKQIEYDVRDKLELAEENIKALNTRLEIERMERKHDLQEFSKILKNCNYDFSK